MKPKYKVIHYTKNGTHDNETFHETLSDALQAAGPNINGTHRSDPTIWEYSQATGDYKRLTAAEICERSANAGAAPVLSTTGLIPPHLTVFFLGGDNMTSYAYDKPYVINSASILLYKSSRKNAMCSDNINISHLISHESNRMIPDDRIMDQFINTVDSIVSQAIIFNHHLEISCYMDIGKASDYISANNITCHKMEPLRYHWDRVKFNSIESAINFVYSIYCMIYPYNHLHLANTIYENPSIKYHIKRFYHGGENSVSTI